MIDDVALYRASIFDKRCLAYHCPDGYRSVCRWHIQPVERPAFQPAAVGDACPVFEERQWGEGPEVAA